MHSYNINIYFVFLQGSSWRRNGASEIENHDNEEFTEPVRSRVHDGKSWAAYTDYHDIEYEGWL